MIGLLILMFVCNGGMGFEDTFALVLWARTFTIEMSPISF